MTDKLSVRKAIDHLYSNLNPGLRNLIEKAYYSSGTDKLWVRSIHTIGPQYEEEWLMEVAEDLTQQPLVRTEQSLFIELFVPSTTGALFDLREAHRKRIREHAQTIARDAQEFALYEKLRAKYEPRT